MENFDKDGVCLICEDNGYIQEFYERNKCWNCNEEKQFRQIDKFKENSFIYHIPSSKFHRVNFDIISKPEPFTTLNDFNVLNYSLTHKFI